MSAAHSHTHLRLRKPCWAASLGRSGGSAGPGLDVLSTGQCVTAVGLKWSCQDAWFLSLSLYTSAIAFHGLHHCISCRGGRAQLMMDTVIITFELQETLNKRLFIRYYKECVLMGYTVHKMNDNIVSQLLPDSPFYWWYERKVRQLFADKVVKEEAWVRKLANLFFLSLSGPWR